MTVSDWIGIIGVISSVIGTIVGIIGGVSLNKSNKINAGNMIGSTVQQADTIIVKNGLDDITVIKLAKDISNEEIEKAIKKFRSETPRVTMSKESPANPLAGDILFEILMEENESNE